MNNQNGNITNEWITINGAVEITNYTERQIRKLKETGKVHTIKNPNARGNLYNKKDLIQYEAAHPKKRPDNVWGEINSSKDECFYPLFGYDNVYFISNKAKVINTTNGRVLTPQPHIDIKGKETGYLTITLMQVGKAKTIFLHKLVAMTQVDNALKKTEIHHIDCNPSNNKASNLLPVYKYQHDELHRLLNAEKEKEYKELVKKIKKENSQEIYKIPHPDYKEDDNFYYYMYLSKDAYKAFNKNGDIPSEGIIKESAELKKNNQ